MDIVFNIVNIQLLSTLDGTSQWKMFAVFGWWDARGPVLLPQCFGVLKAPRAEIDSE